MGYKLAGFDVVGCCEIDPTVNAVYRANLHPRHSYLMDVRDFLKLEDLPPELLDLDVLDGSPPCTTFSMCGDREKTWGREKRFAEGQKLQRLDDLFFTFLDIVGRLRPKAVVAENVEGLLQGNARGYVNEIIARFRELGYSVQLFLLDASKMGVPQVRRRCFFIANRMGWPRLDLSFDDAPIPFGEVRTECGRPCDPASETAKLFSDRRAGEPDLRNAYRRKSGKQGWFNNKVTDDGVVHPTVAASGLLLRGCDGCWLSKGDLMAVSTWPQDYEFGAKDTPSGVQFLLGMSVPPVMTARIAAEIRRQWLA